MGDAASPNRVAIVTGAGGGIGLAIARRLEADGARVMFADLDEAAARKAAGKTGEAFWGDLSEEKVAGALIGQTVQTRSEEHTSELQSLMRNSYAVFRLKTKNSSLTTKATIASEIV